MPLGEPTDLDKRRTEIAEIIQVVGNSDELTLPEKEVKFWVDTLLLE